MLDSDCRASVEVYGGLLCSAWSLGDCWHDGAQRRSSEREAT